MRYWLLKSEPSVFSIEDLAQKPDQVCVWDGVRNYQARNLLRDDLKKNDLAFFYHSSCKQPGIVGIVKVVREAYPDPTQEQSDQLRWVAVDVKLVKIFSQPITLQCLRTTPALKEMIILRKGNRLSVTEVKKNEWEIVLQLYQQIGETHV